MQPTEETTSYLVPFALAATAAGALALVLITFLLGRRTEHRRIAAALGALGGHHADPVRGARAAADEAVRLDSALAELRTIIDTAPAGIVALDRLDRIVTINSAATRLLDAADRSAEGRLLVELARSPELDALIAAARESGRRADAELTLYAGAASHRAACSVVPLSRSVGTADLLLVLEDRTELRRLEGLRTEFVANVSHELRTPITSIRGYAETLCESVELDPQATRFAQTIARSANRLGAIIEDLLLLSSLEDPSSHHELSSTPVRIAGIMAEAVEQCSPAAKEKRVTIETAIDPALWVNGNAGLLAHAVANLLSNAVKYGPADGRVRVSANADGANAVIHVKDSGPGIPEIHRSRLFERFYRVDRARSRDSGGTGLGLAIVKHVAMVHHGSVEVESRTDADHGSTFRMRIPLAAPDSAPNMPLAAARAPSVQETADSEHGSGTLPGKTPGRQSA